MPEKKKEKKKSSQGLSDKVEVIYEILSVHKMSLEELEDKIKKMSVIVEKVKSRMGL
jgi:hypothetical protein|tara:strand:- start:234 stop:404 length:171 start_codon:yes stop_codon:yes gene_type:complete